MLEKKQHSKRNLKKSLYFGGSMAVVSAAGGLAVSIPIYNQIQDKLHKNISRLADLSSFMSQLVDKLGVSPDQEFSRELEGGYSIVMQNGVTRIFQSVNGERSLVMNMNLDGSVGSAASFDGLAAQKMLSVVSSAASLLGEESQAMESILSPFVEEAEKQSIQIESAVTGLTREQILIRNAVAVNNEAEKQAQLAALAAEEHIDVTSPAAQATIHDMEIKVEEQKKEQVAAAEDKSILAAIIANKQKEIDAAKARIKDAYIDFILASPDNTQTRPQLLALTFDEIKEKYNAAKAAAAVLAAKQAQEKSSEEAVKQAEHGGRNQASIIERIISNPSTFLNTFVKTFGYDDGAGNITPSSPNLRKIFYNQMKTRGVTDDTFNRWMHVIGEGLLNLPKNEVDDWKSFKAMSIPKRKVIATEAANTYAETQSDISRLIALEVNVEMEDKSKHDGYVLVRSSTRHILDLETTNSLFDFPVAGKTYPTEKLVAVKYLTKVINADVYTQVKNEAIKQLITISSGRDDHLIAINDHHFVDKIKVLSDFGKTVTDKFLKNYLADLSIKIAEETLFHGKVFDFDPTDLINAIKLSVEHDLFINPSLKDEDLDSVYVSSDTLYGDWMKNLQQIFDTHRDQMKARIHALSIFYTKYKDRTNTLAPLYTSIFESVKEMPDYEIASDPNRYVLSLYEDTDPLIHEFVNLGPAVTREDLFIMANSHIGKPGKVASFQIFKDHIKQFMSVTDEAGNPYKRASSAAHSRAVLKDLLLNHKEFTQTLLTAPDADITTWLKDSIKLLSLKSSFDISNHALVQSAANVLSLYRSSNANVQSLISQSSTTFDWLFNLTKEIGKTGKVNTLTDLITHIDQMFAVTDDNGNVDTANVIKLIKEKPEYIKTLLTAPDADITTWLKDSIKLLSLKSSFDISNHALVQSAANVLSLYRSSNTNVQTLIAQTSTNFDQLFALTKEIGTTGHVADLANLIKHVDQLFSVTNSAGNVDTTNILKLINRKIQFVEGTLLSSKDDITFEVSDAIKLINANPNFDLTDENNIQKVQAASGVSEALASTGISQAEVDAISDQVRDVLTAGGASSLTPAEFDQVVEYTNTVFKVFTNTSDAVAQLKKVLAPTTLKSNVDKIRKFNEWIEAISTANPGVTITKEMIEKYVWTYKGLVAHDTPALPWDATTHPPLTSIIPTEHDGLLTVLHNHGGLAQITMPEGTSGPRFTDIFTGTNTDTPLGQGSNGAWSSTGSYDAVHNIVISGNLVMSGSNGLINIWDLNTKKLIQYRVKNTADSAQYIRNIFVSKTGKVIMVDEGGSMYQLDQTISEILALPANSQLTFSKFLSSNNEDFSTKLAKIFAAGTYNTADGKTILVISDNGGSGAQKNRITKIDMDTGELISQTPIGDYFYGLAIDQKNGYAYGVGEANKQLWRIDINDPTKSEMLLAIDDLKDQDGNSNPLPEGGTTFRGIFYDNVKKEIVATTDKHWAWIADNTNELNDIFNYLMKH